MDANGAVEVTKLPAFQVDANYEFSAPQYFDFCTVETSGEAAEVESWFETAVNYAASPYVGKCKPVCKMLKDSTLEDYIEVQKLVARISSEYQQEKSSMAAASSAAMSTCPLGDCSTEISECSSKVGIVQRFANISNPEPCTPENNSCSMACMVGGIVPMLDETSEPTLREQIAKNPTNMKEGTVSSALNLPLKRFNSDVDKEVPTSSWTRMKHNEVMKSRTSSCTTAKKPHLIANKSGTWEEQQGSKRQKLEGGRLKQIPDLKNNLLSRAVPTLTIPQEFHFSTEDRSRAFKEVNCSKSPFISVAEMIQKIQTKTPERFRKPPSCDSESVLPKGTVLKLTRPKEPELETSQRVRPPRVKSFFELEEEMLASIPKFKARPLKRKMLEAPTLPLFSRSTAHLPEFQEFNLRTMERALMQQGNLKSIEGSSTLAQPISELKDMRRPAIERVRTTFGVPHLETSLRARPPRVKSTEEMEQEELAKRPKFKARPFNKRIFSSRGDMGILCSTKRKTTMPHEFHFSTDVRSHRHSSPPRRGDSMVVSSLQMQARDDFIPRLTIPEPFHFSTEVRGAAQQAKFQINLLAKEEMENSERIPRANVLPYTTNFPSIPHKPQPRQTTKPEPFHLESLHRHEEEQQRRKEEILKSQKVDADLRNFHASPVPFKFLGCGSGPIFVPEKSRKPLTEIQSFVFRAEARAIKRSEFNNEVAKKQMQYQKMKEEIESARKEEEDKYIKELRKELVFHARPVPEFGTPFTPLRSTKELTQPWTPRLHTSRLRHYRAFRTSEMPLCHMR
eukprot:c18542_g1_i2 orf=271-2646(+)